MTPEQAQALGWKDRSEEFAAFCTQIDTHLIRISSLASDDLPDWDYASAFESEMSPLDCAYEVLAQAGFPLDLLEEGE